MAKLIQWSKKAKTTFYKTAEYLEETYSKNVADKFVKDVFDRIDVVSSYPTIGRKSPKRKTVRFVIIRKHIRIYYRIKGKYLIIANLFDTRQNPEKDYYQ